MLFESYKFNKLNSLEIACYFLAGLHSDMYSTNLFLFSYSTLLFDYLKISVKILILQIFKISSEWKFCILATRKGQLSPGKKKLSYLPRRIYYHKSCKALCIYSIFLLWLSLLWEISQWIDNVIMHVTKFSP